MKKLMTLTLALMLASGLAFAQNTGTVTQNGDANTADIEQENAVMTGNINQDGNRNDAVIEQLAGPNSGGPRSADTDQIGNDNKAKTVQNHGGSFLTYGYYGISDNTAVQRQEGNENTADIVSGRHSDAFQYQYGNTNDADITQGGNNWAKQYQDGNSNDADISQQGATHITPNEAEQRQIGDSHVAYIMQSGENNTAYQRQMDGNSSNASAEMTADNSSATQIQKGSLNDADIVMVGNWPAGKVVDMTAKQTQEGSNNTATIKQETNSGHGGDTAEQNQKGDDNYARAKQFSWDSKIYQIQDGTENDVHAFQKSSDNYIRQYQKGEGNWANVDEQAGDGLTGNNEARQDQIGDFNKTMVAQYNGQDNFAKVYQEGDNNWAGEGYNNGGQFGIYQSGDNNSGTINQFGDNNVASITQTNP